MPDRLPTLIATLQMNTNTEAKLSDDNMVSLYQTQRFAPAPGAEVEVRQVLVKVSVLELCVLADVLKALRG